MQKKSLLNHRKVGLGLLTHYMKKSENFCGEFVSLEKDDSVVNIIFENYFLQHHLCFYRVLETC